MEGGEGPSDDGDLEDGEAHREQLHPTQRSPMGETQAGVQHAQWFGEARRQRGDVGTERPPTVLHPAAERHRAAGEGAPDERRAHPESRHCHQHRTGVGNDREAADHQASGEDHQGHQLPNPVGGGHRRRKGDSTNPPRCARGRPREAELLEGDEAALPSLGEIWLE